MRRSLNELHRLCQKAAEGAGAPAGLDIEVAQNTVWLARHGFAVLERLAWELERTTGADACTFSGDDVVAAGFDATGKPGALLAPLLVALLIARASGNSASAGLVVTGFSDPLYLLPVAVGYASQGWGFRFDLSTPLGEQFAFCVTPSDTRILGSTDADALAPVDDREFSVSAQCARASEGLPGDGTPRLALLATRDSLAAAESQSLGSGVEVDTAIWDRLQALASRVLVPATEASRVHGAGSGGSDNE